jgi:hypothetical protein
MAFLSGNRSTFDNAADHVLDLKDGLDFLDAKGGDFETGEDIKQLLKTNVPAAIERFGAEHESIRQFLYTKSAEAQEQRAEGSSYVPSQNPPGWVHSRLLHSRPV